MKLSLRLGILLGVTMLSSPAVGQTATVKVPNCLQVQGSVRQFIPCSGTVPVDSQTGDALSWADLFNSISVTGSTVPTGNTSPNATPIQNTDGSKIATEAQLVSTINALNAISTKLTTLNTALGSPLQAGSSVGISGSLPGFAATPTVNIGTMPAITVDAPVGGATSANQVSQLASLGAPTDAAATTTNATATSLIAQIKQLVVKMQNVVTALGTPMQSGGNIGNTAFGISGTLPAFASTPTVNIGTMPSISVDAPVGGATSVKQDTLNTAVGSGTDVAATTTDATATSLIAQAKQLVVKVQSVVTALGTPLQAGGNIGNTSFGATQSGTWNVGVTGTVSVNNNSLGASGSASTLLKQGTGAADANSLNVVIGGQNGPLATTTTLGTSANTIGNIGNSSFGISGTLPAFAATPTVNIGTMPAVTASTSGQVTTAAPTYANGTSQALSLTTSGALRVDTGPSSGTVTANIGTTNGLSLDTTTNSLFKAGQSIGNTSFGISGTLPAFASTPTVNIGTMPAVTASTSGLVATASPTYTNGTTQSLSLTTSGALRVDTGPSSGTVTANIGTTNGLALNTTVEGLFKSGQNIGNTSFGISGTLPAYAATPTFNLGTAPALTVNNQATVSTAAPSYTNGTQAALSLTPSGALRVDTGASGGAVTANIGTTGGLALDTTVNGLFKSGQSIGNTAFGISGTLPAFASTPTVNIGTMPAVTATTSGAVTTAAPSYTPDTSQSLSLTTAGGLRVDGSGTTQPVSGTLTANLGTLNGAATAANQVTMQTSLGTAGTTAYNGTGTGDVNQYLRTIANAALDTGAAVVGINQVGGANITLGSKTASASLPVTLSTDGIYATNSATMNSTLSTISGQLPASLGSKTNATSVSMTMPKGIAPVITSIPGSTSTTQLLANNPARVGCVIVYNTTSDGYMAFNALASSTAFTYPIVGSSTRQKSIFTCNQTYTGPISAILDTATGSFNITEW